MDDYSYEFHFTPSSDDTLAEGRSRKNPQSISELYNNIGRQINQLSLEQQSAARRLDEEQQAERMWKQVSLLGWDLNSELLAPWTAALLDVSEGEKLLYNHFFNLEPSLILEIRKSIIDLMNLYTCRYSAFRTIDSRHLVKLFALGKDMVESFGEERCDSKTMTFFGGQPCFYDHSTISIKLTQFLAGRPTIELIELLRINWNYGCFTYGP